MNGQPTTTAGIDVGNQAVKAVILKGAEILSWAVIRKGVNGEKAIIEAMGAALARAGVNEADIASTIATGAGRRLASQAQRTYTDIHCAGRGATWLYPGATTVVDMGAEECRILKCNSQGKVVDFFKNDKCAAGVGMFIETMARVVGVTLEEAGVLSLKSQKNLDLSTSCVIFAESEVVSLVNRGESVADVLRAVHTAAAAKTASLLRRLWAGGDIVLIGGVARNGGYVERLKQQVKARLLIPENPEIVTALGAALLAQDGKAASCRAQ